MREHHHPRRSLFFACHFVLIGFVGLGCQSSEKKAGRLETSSSAQPVYHVSIDRGNNGAAIAGGEDGTVKATPLPRMLSFEMVGSAGLADAGASQQARAAATQAAIIDAFRLALIEARRTRGQTTSGFTAELGPRLKVEFSPRDDGYEFRVCLRKDGVQKEFVVVNGALQHEPHEWAFLHQIFEDTRGEFSLLGTDWEPLRGECVATVGCYLPEGYDTKVAFDEADENAPIVQADP